jgi:hypothetical protein
LPGLDLLSEDLVLQLSRYSQSRKYAHGVSQGQGKSCLNVFWPLALNTADPEELMSEVCQTFTCPRCSWHQSAWKQSQRHTCELSSAVYHILLSGISTGSAQQEWFPLYPKTTN